MCGILGVLPGDGLNTENFTQARDTLFHRGPNAGSNWLCPKGHIALAHRRLAIVDLSSAGAQPMHSACGRYVIVFNGEIYNHLALRKELATLTPNGLILWKGHSDTETLIQCFSTWGAEITLQKISGMFAFAIWDKQKRTLCLARDRMGEKPLYYGIQGSRFVFSSELKALKHLVSFEGRINPRAASSFLRQNYILAPQTLYENIFKLPPGTWLEVSLSECTKTLPEPKHYWSLENIALAGATNTFTGSFQDACDELEFLLKASIKSQLMSDLPVGAFLSGGIDSSLIVALMQSLSDKPVTTLSLGMTDFRFDESRHAAAVAAHLGTDHISATCDLDDILQLIPKLPSIWDEPLGDSSQLPTWLVCNMAKQYVTVALSGDGGDELFLGYPHYSRLATLWNNRWLGHVPYQGISKTLQALGISRTPSKILAYGKACNIDSPLRFIQFMMDLYRDGQFPARQFSDASQYPITKELPEMYSNAALWDMYSYLPDDILTKVDRAAMNVSLETRIPFLNQDIVEFALRLPLHFKYSPGTTKKILREILIRYVPQSITERPKQGFSIPVAQWLKYELKDWGLEMLEAIRSNSDFWNYDVIREMWQEHQLGARDHSQRLWGAFSLAPFLDQRPK